MNSGLWWIGVVALLACSSSPATIAPAAGELGLDCGDRTCREVARDHALGRGVPRDDAAAARLLEKGCDGGAGDRVACRELGGVLMSGRGLAHDRARAILMLDDACTRGDVVTCVLLVWTGTRDLEPSIGGRLDTACRAQDLEACALATLHAGLGAYDCGSSCQELRDSEAVELCRRGEIGTCSRVARDVLSSCREELATCDRIAAEASDEVRDAYYAFVVAERARRCFSSPRGVLADDAQPLAA